MKYAAIVLFAILFPLVLWWLNRRDEARLYEIAPASHLKEKYGLTAENRPEIKIDTARVPELLRDLIPVAEKWGIGDDIIRTDFEDKASEAEKKEFSEKLRGRTKQVSDWLDSFKDQPMPEAAVPFMYMLLALDESGLWSDPPTTQRA